MACNKNNCELSASVIEALKSVVGEANVKVTESGVTVTVSSTEEVAAITKIAKDAKVVAAICGNTPITVAFSEKMQQIEGSERTVEAELVLIAAGFLGSEQYVTEAFGVATDARTNVASEKGSHQTNVPDVFTAGDMHSGQSLVVRAIRDGRECAKEVDLSLMGYTNL